MSSEKQSIRGGFDELSSGVNYTSATLRVFVSTLSNVTDEFRALEKSDNKVPFGSVNSHQFTSYMGIIVVLSILVVGGLLFTICRLHLKAAVYDDDDDETTTTHHGCRHAGLLYSADSSLIAVPINLFPDDDDDCSECGQRHITERRRTS